MHGGQHSFTCGDVLGIICAPGAMSWERGNHLWQDMVELDEVNTKRSRF